MSETLPFLITDYYSSLIDFNDPDDPLARQVIPSEEEKTGSTGETEDPLAELNHSFGERLIHRYANRVAFLATDTCAQYCRFCFRRRFTGAMQGCATDKQVREASDYLKKHPEIREMLLTGGDPLTLPDEKLDSLISEFRLASPNLIIRICTRIPVVLPDRITDSLIAVFRKHNSAPFYLMVQFNHPGELTQSSIRAVSAFINAGIPAFNQTVLLNGVNDSADTLEKLFNGLVAIRVKPYYLFQGDLVRGTSCFRVPLEKGLAIEKELRRRLSGLAMPLYAADLPEGGGKVPLCGSYIEGKTEDGVWIFRTVDGERRFYPDPK